MTVIPDAGGAGTRTLKSRAPETTNRAADGLPSAVRPRGGRMHAPHVARVQSTREHRDATPRARTLKALEIAVKRDFFCRPMRAVDLYARFAPDAVIQPHRALRDSCSTAVPRPASL